MKVLIAACLTLVTIASVNVPAYAGPATSAGSLLTSRELTPEQRFALDRVATVSTTGISDADKKEMQRQRPLVSAASAIRSAIEMSQHDGFAGISLDAASVIVRWKGDLPPSVNSAIHTARLSVNVKVVAAKYSLSELHEASELVMGQVKTDPTSETFGVSTPVDGSGITVLTTGNPESARLKVTKTKVAITAKQAIRPRPTSRQADDPSRFSGGSTLVNREGRSSVCTSGFGVSTNGFFSGTNFLVTAGHCGRVGSTFYNDKNVVGSGYRENVAHDVMLIGNLKAASEIYDGGPTSNQFKKSVVGWDWSFAGEYVCHSGQKLGAVCGIQNTDELSFSYCSKEPDLYGHLECYSDLILAGRAAGTASLGGDSGGPVFTLAGNGQVVAKGITNGGGSDAKISSGSLKGQWAFTYQDFATVWKDFGVLPITGKRILMSYNQRCLDGDWSSVNDAQALMWECNANPQQGWSWNSQGDQTIRSLDTGKCLDATSSKNNGVKLRMRPCDGKTWQKWTWDVDGRLRNLYSQKCADAGEPIGNGNKVQLWDCNGTAWQRWLR